MATSAFDDRSAPPDADQLAQALGRVRPSWDGLVAELGVQYPPLSAVWKFGGKQWGWALQLKQRKRTVVWLTPCRGHFVAGFALGEKAVEAARRGNLPSSVLEIIDGARRYAEGRAVRVTVRTTRDASIVRKLVAAKMAKR